MMNKYSEGSQLKKKYTNNSFIIKNKENMVTSDITY